jgi:hypothetical protein
MSFCQIVWLKVWFVPALHDPLPIASNFFGSAHNHFFSVFSPDNPWMHHFSSFAKARLSMLLCFPMLHHHTVLYGQRTTDVPSYQNRSGGYIMRRDDGATAVEIFEYQGHVIFVNRKFAVGYKIQYFALPKEREKSLDNLTGEF